MADEDDDMPTAPFWMSTFSDMATLLMTFFILIVAMSEVQVKRFKEALSYFQGRTSIMEHESVVPPMTNPTTASNTRATAADKAEQAEQYEKLLAYLEAEGLEGKVQVDLTEEGLHVTITDDVMFESGRAILIEPSRTILRTIAEAVEGQVTSVAVRGHTDDRPIATARFPSNWELSGARAASVVRFLLGTPGALPPERYTAAGFAEHHPLTSNATVSGRARNRRVEIDFSWQPWPNPTTPQTPPLSPTP